MIEAISNDHCTLAAL